MFPKQNIFCSDLLLTLGLPPSIVLIFGASRIFFPFGNGNPKCNGIFNGKKTLTVTWREEEFYFSIYPFYVCFLSHLLPFILSLISEKKEGKPLFGGKVGAIFCPHFQLRD